MTRPTDYLERRWWALALLCMTQFMVVLDASIVNIALPSIGEDVGISQENLSWVVNGYVLTFGGFLLLGGRLADLLGRRRIFMAGLIIVAVASLFAGFAPSEGALIAARAAQGLGAAIIAPSALSIVTTIFRDGSERNKALGAWGAVAGSGGAVGVLLGGVLTDGLGWEWVMWVNVPVALAVLALTPGLIPESRSEGQTRHFDAAGAVTVTAGLSLLVYAIVDAESAGWGSTQTIGLLALALGLLGVFAAVELRSRAPLVPFGIFRKQTLTGANVVGLMLGASLFAMFFFITLYMQQVLGYSPIKAGLSYLPLSVAIILSAGVASQLVTKIGFKPVMAVGLGPRRGRARLVQPGLRGRRLQRPTSSGPHCWPRSGSASPSSRPRSRRSRASRISEQGLASGLINTSQQIGGALGLAILATVANRAPMTSSPRPAATPPRSRTRSSRAFRRPSSAPR